MAEIDGVSLPFVPIGGVNGVNKTSVGSNISEPKKSFKDVFDEEISNLKFSAHAKTRIQSREIDLSAGDISRLQNAVAKANDKGAKESLILVDEKAFIVGIPNKTVITVVPKNQMQNNVITDIDSAIIA